MARQMTTRYLCDSCGSEVQRQGDLRRFLVIQGSVNNAKASLSTELCDDCEARFLATLGPFLPAAEAIADLRRDA